MLGVFQGYSNEHLTFSSSMLNGEFQTNYFYDNGAFNAYLNS